MSLEKFSAELQRELAQVEAQGMAKGREHVISEILRPRGSKGPRVLLTGYGEQEFLRMNTNGYLGLALHDAVIGAEETTTRRLGAGPGAVRFIAGTYEPHVALERRLAGFHSRESCMITSSAYTTVLGVIVSLTTPQTAIISDELNHNCIINAMRLARPKSKAIYPHLHLGVLEAQIQETIGEAEGVIIVTDGVFSMRGDLAPLAEIRAVADRYSDRFDRGVLVVVDDSHGVGALGATGRGTEEQTGVRADILIGTLGKAFGVNGGYVVSASTVIRYLREKNPLYIFTNPISPSEAASALAAVEIVDSPEGRQLVGRLHQMTERFERGIDALGYETIFSPHPVVPLLVRDTARTVDMVRYLHTHGVLATGLNFPVVPKGEELIRFQVSANMTPEDIDMVLGVLEEYKMGRK